MNSRPLLVAWMLLAVLCAAGTAHADVIYTVSLDTSLIAGAAGYALVFQLTDGSGGVTGDANNTATLSSFAFGGGSAGFCCTVTGGATGNATGSVVLTDSDFFNSLAQDFTPGTSLSFILDLTTNVDAGGTPDLFGFSLLHNGTAVPTTDDLGGDTFLYVNIDSSSPVPLGWAALDGSLSAPTIAPASVSSVPEPASMLLVGMGLVGLVAVVRRGAGT